MKKILCVIVLLGLAGCAGSVYRHSQYRLTCRDCKTPYGVGDVELSINKILIIDRSCNCEIQSKP